MNERPAIVISNCCCNRCIAPGDKSVSSTTNSILGANHLSRHGEINNIGQLSSLRSQLNYRNLGVDQSVGQTDTFVPCTSHSIVMDGGDADNITSRYLLHNSSSNNNNNHHNHGSGISTPQGYYGNGSLYNMKREKPLVKNRRSESCFDLMQETRYVNNHDNGRLTPNSKLRRSFTVVSPSHDSWSTRTSSQKSASRKACSKTHDETQGVVAYLTPLQRKDRELKQIKKEMTRMAEDLDERDSLILSLKYDMDTDTKSLRDEMDRKISEFGHVLKENDQDREAKDEEIKKLNAQLEETQAMLSKVQMEQEKEMEQFKEKNLDMYIKGQRAAAFEREEELEMLTSKRKEKVTARELARKLSRSEIELAKWQTLRLEEAYSTASTPESSSEVTLTFLKDSFYHFITNPLNCLQHFRAMVEIFKYTDEQRKIIRKSISDSKELKKILKRD